ncbi:perlucin-like protein [Physella acuta]|uniref:perlucin-like protein n=1 Tax=Physella acuta TaxID=109671 RepID=UPI0027DCE5A4|nr:perlucin-like protein [Physella acuta]
MLLFTALLLHAVSGFVSGCDYGYSTPIGDLFDPPATYNGHTYYLSKSFYLNADQAQSVCLSYGMFLVEVNDAGEYKFVQDLARKANPEGLLISGTDMAQEGKWTFQFSKEPVKFFDWYKGNPDNYGGGEDYLTLYRPYNYQMNDVFYGNRGGYKFLCEKCG